MKQKYSLYTILACIAFTKVLAGPVSGAIFTTTEDGTVVNENVRYEQKEDVYLDGGPGPRAPSSAASLPEGNYYFQVTDPSGKDLLSTDHISCREVHVNEHGVIDEILTGSNWVKEKGQWIEVECSHNFGIDQDHSELGAKTVQLYPYDDTPNPGGVYKAWMTPTSAYIGNLNATGNGENYQPGNYHGFIPSMSKTDNYKVKSSGKPFTSPVITVRKFHDLNGNGVLDTDEVLISGWPVAVVDPIDLTNTVYTTAITTAAEPGSYLFTEELLPHTKQTVAILDGQIISQYPSATPIVEITVLGNDGETHDLLYGNIALGSIQASKVLDINENGTWESNEPLIVGWKMSLSGTDLFGNSVGPIVTETDNSGIATFENLLPGTYVVEEVMPTSGGWVATSPTSHTVVIESKLVDGVLTPDVQQVLFTNTRTAVVDFDTKGYWHNKNGLSELTQEDIDYVNSLAPYAQPSSYFEQGDEPFDGYFSDMQTPVAAAKGSSGEEVAPAGSFQAEVSLFLVESNGTTSAREQLAQQLLAFIFNVQHRLYSVDAAVQMADQTFVPAIDLINQAIYAWQYGSDAERVAIKDILDAFNNNNAVVIHPALPGPIVY